MMCEKIKLLYKRYLLESSGPKIKKRKENNPRKPTVKSQLMEEAAIKKGLKTKRMDYRTLLVDLDGKGSWIAFEQMMGPTSSWAMKRFCFDKSLAREMLKNNGLNVTESQLFFYYQREEALDFAEKLDYSVVVKPPNGVKGDGVTLGIKNQKDFKKAFFKAAAYSPGTEGEVLVENFFKGFDYRVIMVDGKVFSVHHKMPANVTGDGKATIQELIKRKNSERNKMTYLTGKDIPLTMDKLDALGESGLTLKFRPCRK
ncbi:hypothetical protein [Negadavirga shengliensis]|uniref:ATP-grasp domain-containing protein n=1 Tax=Negadavirga shengliensis TaxID=1389218 RepID=A0ABV9SYU3_9BACT